MLGGILGPAPVPRLLPDPRQLSPSAGLSRPLDQLPAGDQVVVTRLRRIGRSRQHLLDLSARFEQHNGPDLGGAVPAVLTFLDDGIR